MSRLRAIRDAFGEKFRAKFACIPTAIQNVQNVSRVNSMQRNHKRPPIGTRAMRFLYVPLPGFAGPGTALIFDSSVEIC